MDDAKLNPRLPKDLMLMRKKLLTQRKIPLRYPEYNLVVVRSGLRSGTLSQIGHVANLEGLPLRLYHYATQYRFSAELREVYPNAVSASDFPPIPCYSDYFWLCVWNQNPAIALENARRVIAKLAASDPHIGQKLFFLFVPKEELYIGIPSALFGMKPSVNLPTVQMRLAGLIADDIFIIPLPYYHSHPMNLPNTLDSDSYLFTIPLSYNEVTESPITDIIKLARRPRGKPFYPLDTNPDRQAIPDFVQVYEQVRHELAKRASASTQFSVSDSKRMNK